MPSHSEIDSPCLGVCVMDASAGRCHGCFRTPAQIQIWPRATVDEKQVILAEVRVRRKQAGLPESPLATSPRAASPRAAQPDSKS